MFFQNFIKNIQLFQSDISYFEFQENTFYTFDAKDNMDEC